MTRRALPALVLAIGAVLTGAGAGAEAGTAGAGAAGASAAGGAVSPGDTVVLEDDAGRTVRFAAPPDRIVSLAPVFTEIVFALGAGDRLVGRTRYGVHPPAAREVPSVGEGVRPSMEMIVSREPDVVLLYSGAENRRSLDRLEGMGIPTVALAHDGFGDLYRNLRRLGELTGRGEEARRLEERLRCQVRQVAERAAGLPRPRVYYEVWPDPPMTVGSGSYLDSLLAVAGAVNVFGDLEEPSPRVGLEAIAAREPDLILLSSGEEAGGPPPAERPGWEVLEAVRQGRVRRVDADLVHRLGPRVGEAARSLARVVHPELAEGGLPRLAACRGPRG